MAEKQPEEISPENENTENFDIENDNLEHPEDNPMKVSGSKYLSGNVTKIIIGFIFLAFVLLALALLEDENNTEKQPEEIKKVKSTEKSIHAEMINSTSAGAEGIIPAYIQEGKFDQQATTENKIGENENSNQSPILDNNSRIIQYQPMQLVDPNAKPDQFQTAYEDEEAKQRRMMREQEKQSIRQNKIQRFTNAVESNTTIDIKFAKYNGNDTSSVSPNIANIRQGNLSSANNYIEEQRERINAQMANIENLRNNLAGVPSSSINSDVPFSIKAEEPTILEGDKWTLSSSLQNPKPLALMTGFVIPATLVTGINSDLPGQIIAQVSQNVYDTATGRYLLVPQGTKVIGNYDSGIIFGQERVLVTWNRLVFPDGKNIDIGGMAASDQSGYAGANDLVNNHYLKLFSSALLLSVVSAAATYTQDKYAKNNNSEATASGAMAQSFGNQMGQTTIQVIQKHMNVSPTLEIRPGYKINVMVSKDILFSKPYKNYDY